MYIFVFDDNVLSRYYFGLFSWYWNIYF